MSDNWRKEHYKPTPKDRKESVMQIDEKKCERCGNDLYRGYCNCAEDTNDTTELNAPDRPAQAPAKESGRELWIATRALKLATQDTDFAKSGYWLEIATSQWATQSGEHVEAAGDGFDEWFAESRWSLYGDEGTEFEEAARAAWTACAERIQK